MDTRASLREKLELHRAGFDGIGGAPCPFYRRLCDELLRDVDDGGPVSRWLEPHATAPFEKAYVLRLLGALHRLVLSGDAPDLAAHFPSTGGDGDASATYLVVAHMLADPPALVSDMMQRPPQTNEVGRSIALTSGLLAIAEALRLPVSLREIGTSAGLNLRLDSYWYEQDGAGWGDPGSAVRFEDMWVGGTPPLDADLVIADRRGCDRDPIDATDPDGALTLLSYVWPEPAERFDLARRAIEQARELPVTIDRQDADVWLPRQLADHRPGTAMVIMHSVMWQYLSDADRAGCTEAIETAGRAATPEAPVAWLRLEPHAETYFPAELRARWWDGNSDHDVLLARSGFHGGPLEWDARRTTQGA